MSVIGLAISASAVGEIELVVYRNRRLLFLGRIVFTRLAASQARQCGKIRLCLQSRDQTRQRATRRGHSNRFTGESALTNDDQRRSLQLLENIQTEGSAENEPPF